VTIISKINQLIDAHPGGTFETCADPECTTCIKVLALGRRLDRDRSRRVRKTYNGATGGILANLPAEEYFDLRHTQNMKIKEIAAYLGVGLGVVYKYEKNHKQEIEKLKIGKTG
jgi:hypothetical protein